MKPYIKIAETKTPEGEPLELIEHDGTYMICSNGEQLMTSFSHGSEETLAELACAPFSPVNQPKFLIGGLGMGYTLAAATRAVTKKRAQFIVSELTATIVEWNKSHLSHLNPGLLDDERITVKIQPVQKVIRQASGEYHAILLDVDNGPSAFHGKNNDSLYTLKGLREIQNALKGGGILAVWSARGDKAFTKTLRKAGFDVSENAVAAAHKGRKTRTHTIWLARKKHF
ncbi:spermine synthase [Verrucomicrobiaceae bacterium 5K15]|uniref:Spermine synthase n=1 Tax=Oceaniferula flava TaxID=2800421 RepID=A0AAE2SB97_9BACT|nr:MnmC family methyltransferase [Oceaniferula flavus]MBK1855273.1 spermine synthase [Oceaniferula flavus]MBM1136579.1 spermine synthase [Oceaniferula flavus]